ncbi:peroxisomal membrane protein PEX16 [Orussus abietinus]|uniref:peroxisomal membrane protein PEX16 n=1 Tax=Orussus abietinus TaxID=222816 RepID=UPI0006255D1C|nr:peroxisomal membrane protein PEX16 [Orussus abietinus]
MVAEAISCKMSKMFESYKKWIMENPQLIRDIESTVKWMSYFTIGRFGNSSFISELTYTMPNLLIFFNDRLISINKYGSKISEVQSKIKIWLTVVEYVETLLEVWARKALGESGRWLVISFVQTFKAAMRLILVYRCKERITLNPPFPPLNREKVSENCADRTQNGFSLKRSGMVVRSVRSSEAPEVRKWEPLPQCSHGYNQMTSYPASKNSLILAETLYIIKPLLHLGCLSLSGEKQWKPWLLSLTLDLMSLKLFNQETRTFTQEEKTEIFRRRLSLLLYIMRSPFYDKCSRDKIYSMLKSLSQTVPFARLIAEPVANHLPYWQDTYFYMWS